MKNNRFETIKFIWFTMAIALAALFLSAGIAQDLSPGYGIITVIIMIGAVTATRILAQGEAGQQIDEKAKRQSLEDALRNLSDADLERLRERLHDDNIDDELLTAYLADAQTSTNAAH